MKNLSTEPECIVFTSREQAVEVIQKICSMKPGDKIGYFTADSVRVEFFFFGGKARKEEGHFSIIAYGMHRTEDTLEGKNLWHIQPAELSIAAFCHIHGGLGTLARTEDIEISGTSVTIEKVTQ